MSPEPVHGGLRHVRLTRRAAVRDLGRLGLLVAVLGTGACSGDDAPDGPAGTSPAPEGDEAAGGTPAGGGTSWARVDLGFVSAYLLVRGGEATLVDTGQAGAEADIEAALGGVGLDWSAVGNVILTHRHPDHVGSVEAVSQVAPDAVVHIGAGDLDAVGDLASGSPRPVAEGDRVFGLEVVETPGHTPGHICVLEPRAGILVTGDALNTRDGSLASASADPQFTDDAAQADESVRKLAGLDFDVVLVGHGEPVLTGGSAAVADLAASL